MSDSLDLTIHYVNSTAWSGLADVKGAPDAVDVAFTSAREKAAFIEGVRTLTGDFGCALIVRDGADVNSLRLDLLALQPHMPELRSVLRDMDNLTLIASLYEGLRMRDYLPPQLQFRLLPKALEIRFMDHAVGDLLAESLLQALPHATQSVDELTNAAMLTVPVSKHPSQNLESAAVQAMLLGLSPRLGIAGRVTSDGILAYDPQLDQSALHITITGGGTTAKDMSVLLRFLSEQLDLAEGRDFLMHHPRDNGNSPLLVITEARIRALRKMCLNTVRIRSVLALSESLRYFPPMSVQRIRSAAHPGRAAIYRISSTAPTAVTLAHHFFLTQIGLNVGENHLEDENGHTWLEIDEDDLQENLGTLKSLRVYADRHVELMATLWAIPGVSRVRLRHGLLRIRCDQETLTALSALSGAEIPVQATPSIAHRAYSNRIFFHVWALYEHLGELKKLAHKQGLSPVTSVLREAA